MKIKIKSVLWWALMGVVLTSCSTVDNNQLPLRGPMLAYSMQPPTAELNPYMTTEMRPSVAGAVSADDLKYIADYYALR